MKRTILAVVFVLVMSVGSVFAGPAEAPDFALRSFGGKYVSLADNKGKIVVLEWFNQECPFSKYHYDKATTMIDLANKYKDKGVVWLAIDSTNHITDKKDEDFAAKYKLPYPILDDRSGAVGRAYGARTTPHMFIIDAKGGIVYNGAIDNAPVGKVKKGESAVNYVDQALAELTAGKAVSVATSKPYGCNVKYIKAPPVKLKSFDGKETNLAGYKKKIIVLEWFNYGCPFVKYHYDTKKTMIDLADKYKDKGVVWLAMNSTSNTTDEQYQSFAEKHKLSYPILDDRPGKIGRAYGARTTPHMYIIDAEDNVVYTGAIDNSPLGKKTEGVVNYVDKALAELTSGKKVSTPATKPYGCSVKYPKKAKAQ
jgi:peroxiredoxin